MTNEIEVAGGPSTRWRVLGGVLVLVAVIVGMALMVEHDASGQLPDVDRSIAAELRHDGYLVGFALIYIEESGPPLFIPGDAFLLYVGHRLPRNMPIYLAAWLGFILAVTFGASNLYLLSRRYGRRLLEHRFARVLHLTPRRLAEAERWFARYGPWTLIVGRHVPGFRVPLTVAAGVLKLRYPVFALSVAASSAVWAGLFLTLGAVFGTGIERSIRSAPLVFLAAALIIVAAVVTITILRHRRAAKEARN